MTDAKKPESTRQTILTTGRRLVATGGFGAMGLSALLKESGVPKGSFYHYFASKDAFGQAMLQDYVDEYLVRTDALRKRDATGAEKLMAFCTAWLDHDREAGLVSTCLVVKLGAEVADMSDSMRQVLEEGLPKLTGTLALMIREGMRDGSIHPQDDPDAAAVTLYAQLLGAAILTKLSRDQAPLETVITEIETRMITGATQGSQT
ncbi:TetR/AcrR family transcriptional regulator [Chachezhania antarctica]|uniref:TetR/AcrR family transcriptional regulator n=1 Tax=Chachezhania antarctica TaxID=2340860 RepID=UPI000EAC8431|nr:TetR/AcrR family transcriptional regulator [Chachezhania antarctica]